MTSKLGPLVKNPEVNFCEKCGKFVNAIAEVSEDGTETRLPGVGSIAICSRCGHLAKFTEDGHLEELTQAEEDEALQDRHVLKSLRTVFLLRLQRFLEDAKR